MTESYAKSSFVASKKKVAQFQTMHLEGLINKSINELMIETQNGKKGISGAIGR